uniref:Dihydrofolate reductase n=1 Tax=Panulirus argus virus 1 TaxID=380624 RepID=A0A6G9HE98_9VIRU|nr:dihydrofolate reductase [Panulirus argus virus 1]
MYFKKNLVLHVTVFHNSTGDRLYDANGLKSCIADPRYADKKRNLILHNVRTSNVALLYGHVEIVANLKMLESAKCLYPTLQIYAVGASKRSCDDTFVYIKKNSLKEFFTYNSNDYETVHVLGGLTLVKSVLLHYSHLVREVYVTDFYSGYDHHHPSDLLDRRLHLLLSECETKEFIFNNDVVLPRFSYTRYLCTKNNNQFFKHNVPFKTALVAALYSSPPSPHHHRHYHHDAIPLRCTLRFELTMEKYMGNKYMTTVPSLGLFDPLHENAREVEDYLNNRTVRNAYLLGIDKLFDPLAVKLSAQLKGRDTAPLLHICDDGDETTIIFYIHFIKNGDVSVQIISDNVTLNTISLHVYGALKLFLNAVLRHSLHYKRLVLDFVSLSRVVNTSDRVFADRVLNGCEKHVVYDLSEEQLTYTMVDNVSHFSSSSAAATAASSSR